MSTSTRFAVAVHMLALIAALKPRAVTSETLARSLGANPAAVRRLLGRLAAAGITRGRLGKGGGAVLARPAKKISLLEVYRAVESGEIVARARRATAAGGEADQNLSNSFDATIACAETAFFEALGAVTLKSFVKTAKLKKFD